MSPDKLKTLRKKCKLTQTQAAEIIGVSLRTWQRWETGEVTLSKSHEQLIKLVLRRSP